LAGVPIGVAIGGIETDCFVGVNRKKKQIVFIVRDGGLQRRYIQNIKRLSLPIRCGRSR
jgi:hypothetical protein